MGEVERRGEVERSLDELAAEINAEYRAFEAARNAMLVHALRAGELLLLAKERLPHGQWMGWLQQNFAGSDRTARDYMRVASHRAELEAELEANRRAAADMTLEEALKAISTPKPEVRHKPETENRAIEEAKARGHLHVDAQRVEDAPRSASVFSRPAPGRELPEGPRREAEWSEDECELLDRQRAGETIVVNMHDGGPHTNLVPWLKDTGQLRRVDRPGPWGNPFLSPDDGTREEVVHNFRVHYFPYKRSLRTEARRAEVKGKALGCWCAPALCHAEAIKEWADEKA